MSSTYQHTGTLQCQVTPSMHSHVVPLRRPSYCMQAAAKKAAAKAEEEKKSQRRWIMQYMEDQSESEDEQEQVSAAGPRWAELSMYCAQRLRGSAGAAGL